MLLAMALKLVISAFPEAAAIPPKYTCDGQNISPAIEWTGAPPQAKSFALILDDPDAPSGLFTHWLLYNIPQSTHSTISASAATAPRALPAARIAMDKCEEKVSLRPAALHSVL